MHGRTHDHHMSEASCFFLGMLAGGAAALLLAPRAGKETREAIREGAMAAREKVRQGSEEVARMTREAVDKVSATASEILHKGQERVRHSGGITETGAGL